MTRPKPRRSSLAGASPVAPTAGETSDAAAADPAAQQPAPPAPTPRSRPKVSFFQDAHDTARMRGAILYTMPTEGPRTMSQFIHTAVMAEVKRLEDKYNDGKPFPAVHAREMPQGRPMGS